MNETTQFLARHGYWLLIAAVLARQACLPIPANLFLVAAGALARSGKLGLSGAVAVSVMTFLLADLAWYEAGGRWGDRISATLTLLAATSNRPGLVLLVFEQQRLDSSVTRPGNGTSTSGPICRIVFVD